MKCIIVDDDSMARKTIEQMVKETDFLELLGSFPSSAEAFNFINKNSIDLIFLDIEMPGMTGMEMLENIQTQPLIIFTTGKEQYALEAFNHKTVDYLVKPVSYPKFLKAVLKAKELKGKPKDTGDKWDFILIKSEGVFLKTFYKDIIFIEALGDYINIHTTGKKISVHTTMKTFASKLPDNFLRVHRSFIINTSYLNSIEDNTISLNGKLIPLGVSYRDEIYKKLKL